MNKKIKKVILFFTRLIKSLEILDLLGIGVFFLILAVSALFFLRKSEFVYVTLRISSTKDFQAVWFTNAPLWYLENLKEGLADKNLLGKVNAEVERVYYYPTNATVQTVYVVIKVDAVYNKSSKQYSYHGLPLLVSSFQEFKIQNISIPGVVYHIDKSLNDRPVKKYKVTGFLDTQNNEFIQYPAETGYEGVKNYVADRLKPGLQVKDSTGKVIVEITKVDKSPAKRSFVSGSGIITAPDPERTKVSLEANLTAQEVDGRYLYKEESPLLLNTLLAFDFKDFYTILTVTDFQEIN